MQFNRVIKEATKIISVTMDTGKDYSPNPKADIGTNRVIHMDKKRIIPQVLKKDMKHLDYYVPDMPPGSWKSIPKSWRRFYKDCFNSYPEVTFQPLDKMAKYYNLLKRLMKKYPNINWKKLFPQTPKPEKVVPEPTKIGMF